MESIIIGLVVPMIGIVAGSACVYMIRGEMPPLLGKALTGFAAGVMMAAAVWSLLIPAMEACGEGAARALPAMAGFGAGIVFLLILDRVTPHIHGNTPEGPRSKMSRTAKLVMAITLHHIPEGMAMGVALAAAADESMMFSMAGALALCVGMAIQNFPEGAVVSLPLHSAGMSRNKAFVAGALTSLVQPVTAIATIAIATAVLPALPYMLAFAAGAMVYVVVEELIPETQSGRHSNLGTIGFAVGFVLMMVLDVVL